MHVQLIRHVKILLIQIFKYKLYLYRKHIIKMNIHTPENLEKQEHLSLERIKKLSSKYYSLDSTESKRPINSYINLLEWVEQNFSKYLSDTNNINRLVNNKIILDGNFIQFCEEKKVTIDVLHKDSIVSWKSVYNYESFFVQGVFLIKYKNLEFLQASLFHKGNMWEDEVSFSVIVSEKNYEAYINFRNEFDKWLSLRGRNNSYIKICGAEDVIYHRDSSWDDLFLPDSIKSDIKNNVETFLSSKDFYTEHKIPWKKGILLYGEPGCGKSTLIKVLMSNYDFKPVTIVPTTDNNIIIEAFNYAEDNSPALLFFEDLDSLLDGKVDLSLFLNLMDGITAKNGLLVIATANNITNLKNSVINRPSRFDRKYAIPLPNEQDTIKYLKYWFGKDISAPKLKAVSKECVKNKLSYAYIKEIYMTTIFQVLSKNKKISTDKDLDHGLNIVLKDKKNTALSSIDIAGYIG